MPDPNIIFGGIDDQEPEEKTGPEPTFLGATKGFLDEKFGASESASSEGGDVINNIGKLIMGELRSAAKVLGENPIVFEQIFEQFEGDFWRDVNNDVFSGNFTIGNSDRASFEKATGQFDPAQFLNTEQGFKQLMTYARMWWGAKMGDGVSQAWGASGSGSGSGRGRTLPTEKEIRNQFDLNELARGVSDLWRTFLLEEPDDARALAKSYVDKVVKSRGQKKIDFQSFIEQKIEDTPRFASIYANKPDGVSPAQYLQPLFQTAQSVLRPEAAEGAAIGAAQFGADAQAFQQRLKRSNEFRTSSPFMESLEGRLRSVKGVLKG